MIIPYLTEMEIFDTDSTFLLVCQSVLALLYDNNTISHTIGGIIYRTVQSCVSVLALLYDKYHNTLYITRLVVSDTVQSKSGILSMPSCSFQN